MRNASMIDKCRRILLLHPLDSLDGGTWGGERFDLVIDLGFASSFVYDECSRRLGTRVISIYQFAGQAEGFRWVDQVLDPGRGRLLDRQGIDWWETLGVHSYQDLQILYLFSQLRPEIDGDNAEFMATRPHLFTRMVEQILQKSVRYLQSAGSISRASHMLRSALRLQPAQIVEIAFDKWDTGYRFRRHVTKHKRAALMDPTVLLPSAYSNVTRSALAYAAQLPHRQFLLATTRRSAIPGQLPDNVTATPLSAYGVSSKAIRAETEELVKAWRVLKSTMSSSDEFRHAANAGLWDYFPAHLEHGLRLREAWMSLLASEPIKGVLCGDDLNYHTRLPLMLAHHSGLNAVYCSHGALDGGFLFKMPAAESFLVKGEMEKDYLQSSRAIEPEKIMIGAPGKRTLVNAERRRAEALVFFSQPYEVDGGRADEIYREILPRLCSAAHRAGHKVIVKLHPFESRQARKALAASILPADVYEQLEVIGAFPPEEVMARAWCGVTVDSSIAVECTLSGIPFFICGWLDFGGMGYMRQFARYGVGHVLPGPGSIERIPEVVADYRVDVATLDRLWHPLNPIELDRVLFGSRRAGTPNPCVS